MRRTHINMAIGIAGMILLAAGAVPVDQVPVDEQLHIIILPDLI